MKSKRIEAGRYLVTTDVGKFLVWQERVMFDDYPRRWFVNEEPDTIGETLTMSGFLTKWEAMRWLTRHVAHERK